MKKEVALMSKIIGVFLTILGGATVWLLFVLWTVEENSTHSVPLWPVVFGIGIAVLGLMCIKAGISSPSS